MTRAKTSKANPISEAARARLRAAQGSEAAAVAAVHAAVIAGEKAQAKLEAAVAVRQTAVDEAAATLTCAYADLVAASGVDRAALILDVPKATLKAAVVQASERPARVTPISHVAGATFRSGSETTDERVS
jgi:hypothetical protein